MRYVLTIEAIGDNYRYHLRQYLRSSRPFTKLEINAFRLGNKYLSPWVAKITGLDNRYGFVRDFVKGQKDYSQANSTGSRGIFLHYFLEPGGIYEINERKTWKRAKRYFAKIVDHHTLIEISPEEVIKCLR